MSIALKAAAGVAWNIITGLVVRAVALIGTLVLTRFIPPQDYGQVALASICVLVAGRLFTFGSGAFVIAHRSPPKETFQIAVVHTCAVGVACLSVLFLRERLGVWLGAPGMGIYVPGLALATIMLHVSHVPSATLARSLSFRPVAVSRAAGELAFTVVSVTLAPLWGAAAIVGGNISRAAVTSGLLLLRANREEWLRPSPIQAGTLRRLFAFGLPFSGGALADSVAYYGDTILVSRFFGPRVMAQYNLAYNLADTPTGYVADHIGDVLMPSFATMDQEQRAAAILRAARLIALLVFPLAVGLSVVAPTLVATLLDPRWAGVAPLLAVLSGLSVLRSMSWVATASLQARGRMRDILVLNVVKAGIMIGLIIAVGRHGPLWTCGAVLIAFGVHTLCGLVALRRTEGTPLSSMVRAASSPLLACAGMALTVVLARAGLLRLGIGTNLFTLILEIGVGAITYAVLAVQLARPVVDDLVALARRLSQR